MGYVRDGFGLELEYVVLEFRIIKRNLEWSLVYI